MCGIVGSFDPQSLAPQTGVVRRMLDVLAHRGPDGFGTFSDDGIALGHRRLSILDPTEAGGQPMERHSAVLVHNGEIYNYLELADELRAMGYAFSTETDTEVILAAYDAWGPGGFERFNGMWAFALWDRRRRRLVLSRDRLGVKPLYIRETGGGVQFASEVKALAAGADGSWHPEPDLVAVRDFIVRGILDHSELTFIEGIRAVRPGHTVVVEDGMRRVTRYWPVPALSDDPRRGVQGRDRARDRERIEEFRALFDDSVRLRLRADVPLGTCLSGGLDSSSIVVTAGMILQAPRAAGSADATGHEQQPRFAFHARFPAEGVDESRYAQLVAERAGVSIVYRTPPVRSLLDAVLPVLRAQGEPFAGTSVLAQYAVMEAARFERVKVLLDGQGGDETLGGYLPYLGYRVASLVARGDASAAARELRSQVAFGSVDAVTAMTLAVRALTPNGVIARARPWLRNDRIPLGPALDTVDSAMTEHHERGTLLSRRLWQDIAHDNLPALLRYEDRNSMAFGIEARVPFLDYRLVEFALRLPDRLKVSDGTTKWILRRALRDRLPREIAQRRDKVGFATPQSRWLSENREEIAAVVRGGETVARGWMRAADVDWMLERTAGSGRPSPLVWRLFVLEAWLRDTFAGESGRVTRSRAEHGAASAAFATASR